MTAMGDTKTIRSIHRNPKLKKLVARFLKGHHKFNDDLCRATYRLVQDAAKLGALAIEIFEEGGFKSYRQLHIWLELEYGSSIPERTFYRYINAAADAKKVEAVHGAEKLTEVGSLKALKMLANPRIEQGPDEAPKPALNEPPPKGWKGQNIRHPAANGAAEDAKPEGDDSTPEVAGKEEAAWSRTGEKVWCCPPYLIQHHTEWERPNQYELREGDRKIGDYKSLEEAQKSAREHAELNPFKEASEEKEHSVINRHHGCKDFTIENDRTLSFTDQHGEKVYVVSEKAHIEELLAKAISRYAGR